MNDAMIDLVLQGAGITPGHPQYAVMKAGLQAQGAALSSTQGEDTRRFDLTFQQQQDAARDANQRAKDKLEQDYRIAKLSADNAAESNAIDRWKAEKDYELGQQRLEIDRGNLEVARGAQGLDLLKTDVDLRSQVRNWAKLADWEAGVAASDAAPAFLQALLKNSSASAGSNAPTMTAPIGLPEQNSLTATLANLGVQQAAPAANPTASAASGAAAPSNSATGAGKPIEDPRTTGIRAIINKWQPSGTEGWDMKDTNTLRAVAALSAQGAGKYANRFAQLDDDDQELILGAQARLGMNPERTLRNIDRWRVSNRASGMAA